MAPPISRANKARFRINSRRISPTSSFTADRNRQRGRDRQVCAKHLFGITLLGCLLQDLGRSNLRVANNSKFRRIPNFPKKRRQLVRRCFKRHGHCDLGKKVVLLARGRDIPLSQINTILFRGSLDDRLQLDGGQCRIVAPNKTRFGGRHVVPDLLEQLRVMSLSYKCTAVFTQLLFFVAHVRGCLTQRVQCRQEAERDYPVQDGGNTQKQQRSAVALANLQFHWDASMSIFKVKRSFPPESRVAELVNSTFLNKELLSSRLGISDALCAHPETVIVLSWYE